MSDVTQILSDIEKCNATAAEQLLPLVYDELRKLAAAKIAREKPGLTLEATALVHEAYVRLVDTTRAQQWKSRAHFFKAAAEAMRRILVENARRKKRIRHGGGAQRLELQDQTFAKIPDAATILTVDDAMRDLAVADEIAADVVRLHFFSGFTLEETADVLGMSRASVYRHWSYARAVLKTALQSSHADDD
ncbi:MAG: ECF-type sigma factor [Pirellula sp.]